MSAPNVKQFIDLLVTVPAKDYDNSFVYVMSEWAKQQGQHLQFTFWEWKLKGLIIHALSENYSKFVIAILFYCSFLCPCDNLLSLICSLNKIFFDG